MLLADLPRLLLRRWYATIPGLLGCIALAVAAFTQVSPSYQMTSSVLLLPPDSSLTKASNPYLVLGGLEGTADVVARGMSPDEISQEVFALGVDEYTVVRDNGAAAPILLITIDAGDVAAARAGLDLITDRAAEELVEVQSSIGVAPASLIKSSVIARATQPKVSHTGQLRVALVVFVGSVVMLLMAVLCLDLVLRRLAGRRAALKARVEQRPPEAGQVVAVREAADPRRAEPDPSGPDKAPDLVGAIPRADVHVERSAAVVQRQVPPRPVDSGSTAPPRRQVPPKPQANGVAASRRPRPQRADGSLRKPKVAVDRPWVKRNGAGRPPQSPS